jgi:hypothetical protein
MNSGHTSTLLREHTAQRDRAPARAAHLLARGPARMTSPIARWTANVLAVAGATGASP